jgi:RimJ/RimL family protein N-acetyltransferase
MIVKDHSLIRTADPDDAGALYPLYDGRIPRAFMLDRKREPVVPTRDELRELLAQKDPANGFFYAIEDTQGVLRGLAMLRGFNPEALCSETVIAMMEDADYSQPFAREALDFLLKQAFGRLWARKVMVHLLDTETACRAFMLDSGFVLEGSQREVLYSGGCWHNLDCLGLFRESAGYGPYPGPGAMET